MSSLYAIVIVSMLASCGGDAIATVGGRPVTQAELDAYAKLKQLVPLDAARRETTLTQYLEREALAEAIRRSGRLDAALIAAEVRELERELLINRYFEVFLAEAISDDAVKSTYIRQAAAFEVRRVHAAHILVRASAGLGESERQVKLAKAREARAKLDAGQEFSRVAADYSEDGVSANKGGDLGWLDEGAIDAELSRRVFAMKEGEISEPFQSSLGFHVVKVLEAPAVV
jgi:peptidyl-prolyl cis-trans isomerase C